MQRVLIVGDIHGTLHEFEELLHVVGYTASDRLILLGDLIDRGPYGVECIRLAMQLGCEAMKGNHEDWHVRWRAAEDRARRDPRYTNKMRPPSPQMRRENAELTDDEIAWMRDLPIVAGAPGDWVAVHAGFEPLKPWDKQKADKMIRIRYVKPESGDMWPLGDSLEQPLGSLVWTEMWNRPENVVYGHTVHSLTLPRVDDRRPMGGGVCMGIDTGSCFGGRLSALVLPEGEIVQVPAKKAYYAYKPSSRGEEP